MSIATELDFLPLPQVLQQLAANRVSAKVTVTRREGEGMILLRNGKIIYAATNSAREAVGNLLLTQGLITASALQEALELQGRSKSDRRLGAILIERGAVAPADVERVVRSQIERVLHELFQWSHGFVKVRPLTIEDGGEIEVDASDLLMPEGMPVERVILDAIQMDIGRLRTPPFGIPAADGAGEAATPAAGAADDVAGRPIGLREVLHEIRTTTFTGEVSLHILRFAARFFARGVLFAHGPGELYGTGHFGLTGAEVSERVRGLRVPNREPSVLLEALELRAPFRGPLEERYWNLELVRALGGTQPAEVAALPIMVADRVVLVLYGDDAGGAKPIPDLAELELVLDQSGLALEKVRYETAYRALEKRLKEPGQSDFWKSG